MLPYVVLGFIAIIVLYVGNTLRCFQKNLALAKQSGIPYISLPIYTFNRFWLVTHKLWLPFIRKLPHSCTKDWIDFLVPEFAWDKKYDGLFKAHGTDIIMLVAPGANTLLVADADCVSQITTRRNDFPKPTWLYTSVDLFGKNVVSTEGANWRHHRKITSPPFTEKNNVLVWKESLEQAESMMAGWVGGNKTDSGTIWNVATEAMRLSLHVISRAGFGVKLYWPHEQSVTAIPQGHAMTYKDALETLLHSLIPLMLLPRWLMKWLPFEGLRRAEQSLTEWGQYMREMYEEKRKEVKRGESTEGMDLMGALVKGSGQTEDVLNSDVEKAQSKQLLTDEEIMGNSFVFILAGHETAANTIHFSTLFLAMHMSSQKHLQDDLDQIFGGRPVSEWDYDKDMPKLFGSMCGAVMNEELRLIAPVVGIPKCTAKDKPQGLNFSGRHVTVPPGCYVTMDTAATHRNPQYWPHTSPEDVLEFRPERWLLDPSKTNSHTEDDTYEKEEGLDFDGPDKRPDTAASLYRPPKGAYVPFSEGYRSCLGRRFAQVEILAVLAVMFKNWSVELDVSEYLSDAEFDRATKAEKIAAWEKADARARHLLKNGMGTIITIQMRAGKVPFRFVSRGNERFKDIPEISGQRKARGDW
ncbi:hypothetical protein AC579_8014 [Pseudocercospora musae]|uniref:Cytochrome P450 n=1 Tax=Pseudocercospora musae TaxID=113226 RepID=A0A139HED0_9PEZI|nr:hypothetical protein AC579_8014 [Pseudocercospora musae]